MPKHAKGTDYQAKYPELPYTAVIDQPRLMKGGEMPTVFGVMGITKSAEPTRSLGGLVQMPRPSAPIPDVRKESKMAVPTERHVLGPAAKTHVPGAHYGQVPYPGHFMSALGGKL